MSPDFAKLEALLTKKGIKIAQLCAETGISQPTFSDWKSGKSKPKTDKLYLIAQCLDVHIEDLLGKDE